MIEITIWISFCLGEIIFTCIMYVQKFGNTHEAYTIDNIVKIRLKWTGHGQNGIREVDENNSETKN